ncbi:MAG: hypothetical protein M1483_08480 [Actinobacteria bacterium]|nr:hypothetical protein [Actinomycetota bacterium]MCL6105640.1 hypothetical protein [Actinomycetota bacterium]
MSLMIPPIAGYPLGGPLSNLFGLGTQGVLGAITSWIVSGAAWLLDAVGKMLTFSTYKGLQSGWFLGRYRAMISLAALLALPMMLAGVIQTIMRQEPAKLIKIVFMYIPLAALLTLAAVQLVALGLRATDAASTLISQGISLNPVTFLAKLGSTLETNGIATIMGSASIPMFVVFLVALIVVMATFWLWLELVLRNAAIYMVVLFLPLCLLSFLWPAVSHWSRKLFELIAALILSKLVIVGALGLASAVLQAGGATPIGSGSGQLLVGTALLLLAAFSPFVLFRLVPLIEVGSIASLEGLSHRAVNSLPVGPKDIGEELLSRFASPGEVGGSAETGWSADAGGFGWVKGTVYPYSPSDSSYTKDNDEKTDWPKSGTTEPINSDTPYSGDEIPSDEIPSDDISSRHAELLFRQEDGNGEEQF